MSEDNAIAEGFRCGSVALLGKPNVGKSTLLNQIIGSRIAIVTPKPQTTRHRILGIYTDQLRQVVFIDTPGIHSSGKRMNRNMVRVAHGAAEEADVLALLHDMTKPLDRETRNLSEQLANRHSDRPRIHVLNKIDKISHAELLPRIAALHELDPSADAFVPLSARKGIQVDAFVATLGGLLPERPPIYDPEWFTDQSTRTLAAEYVREQLFLSMQQEIPFQTAVVVESCHEHGNAIDIAATILVGSRSHKPMVIGKQGATLKHIGIRAREGLQELLGRRVDLRLFVKVQANWFEQPAMLAELGLG
ncbi:MAG: GTPase Era [Mariprofundales bacterium]|nr:GTPase Era [Mariprofundales bacterium]